MAKSTRPTANKRAREKARIDRQKEKERRRAEVREKKATAPTHSHSTPPATSTAFTCPRVRRSWRSMYWSYSTYFPPAFFLGAGPGPGGAIPVATCASGASCACAPRECCPGPLVPLLTIIDASRSQIDPRKPLGREIFEKPGGMRASAWVWSG